MKRTGMFFYRLEPAKLLSKLITMPESDRGAWITQIAVDLSNGNSDDDFAKSLIEEANLYSETKRKAAEQRWNKAKQDDALDMHVHTDADVCNARSRSRSRSRSSNSSITTSTSTSTAECAGKIIQAVLEEKRADLIRLFPNLDIPVVGEKLLSHYSGKSPPLDPWMITLKWFQNEKDRGGDNGNNRASGSTTQAGRKTGIIAANGPGTDFLS